ncbi:hypothetical protein PtrSN002B_005216 [Pyrenophora tritici-repentis]|uniref:Frag1 domain containing protein n=2 Tax=Pyrenophora tritici-repentis TaxID=45151 RepID=A0A2W1I0M2_9PLEO|nr:uncharacterized protein PTRG_01043 [Pyrenophora tritici-repentis Pt-1C-BFP]KAA8625680.1 hypothetical protein PtrV1_01360 [Pyrenophora tritici-repentis]EDU40481.1 conserved hypothetical protein [Pyrenophora tritici-repentis Pt-1C-BFP]KAF7454097.1 hypothetical protein A1F99_013550 [Pyrenophora tritici-repentis]KAF7577186.1 Frag1 domain containing protein [Pyrenophora tritici-repentis]KAI0578289.1 hypothetical protein Alg215_06421 [Pyrenophora tritici-repentis]
MSTTIEDYQLAALAAGFTLGFGFLTVWEAVKQTRRNHSPLRSAYIYMIWGEILVNFIIGVIGWLFLNGKLGPSVPVLFAILFFWVFEIQLLMQIIINRIALIAEHRSTIFKLKWGTVLIITTINIAVFCIWIPSHTVPPVSKTFVTINAVWDKISKVIILAVDAGLNYYFLRTVKLRLVQRHGLTKYAPLVGFNGKLMVLSIAMDALLIGLMFLPNQVVYIQFHPVVYMIKLNIEMSMASLVVRLARGRPQNDMDTEPFPSHSYPNSHSLSATTPSQKRESVIFTSSVSRAKRQSTGTGLAQIGSEDHLERGIQRRMDICVNVVQQDKEFAEASNMCVGTSLQCSHEAPLTPGAFGDEMPLQKHG